MSWPRALWLAAQDIAAPLRWRAGPRSQGPEMPWPRAIRLAAAEMAADAQHLMRRARRLRPQRARQPDDAVRPDNDGGEPQTLRRLSQALVLCMLAGSAIVIGTALRSEEKAGGPAVPGAPWPFAEAPIEGPPAGGELKEPERPLPTPGEALSKKSGFVHPGVLVSLSQLNFVRDQILAGRRPWSRAYEQMRTSRYADLDWQPHPREVVECGYYSDPDRGCSDEQRDAVAAYTHALMWYFTGEEDHALKSIEIIDAWSGTLRSHTGGNAALQAAWAATTLVRAAELMRYTYPDWEPSRITRAMEMFRYEYLPEIRNGAPAGFEGNWDLTMIDAMMGIGIFIDIRDVFDKAVDMWRARVPAYIYHSGDGATPIEPPRGTADIVAYWHGQTRFVDGLAQETCRDLSHTGWGLAALAQAAETAWIQSVDLYAEAQQRLVPSLEFHADLELGGDVPDWLCGGSVRDTFNPIPEIAYNHYHNRLGIDMPQTQKLISRDRPQSPSHHFGWATLTSAGVP